MNTGEGIVGRGGFAPAFVRWHFPLATSLLLGLSLVAFGDNLVTDVGQPSNRDPKFIVHGLFLLAWMILLVVQSLLPRFGKLALHRRIGNYGFVVAVGVALSTLWLFAAVWKGFAALGVEAMANRLFLPLYAGCMIGAWRCRFRPDWHKRFVYCGTLFLLEPVLARTYDPLVAPLLPPYAPGTDDHLFYSYMAVVWTAFYLALLAYDRAKNGRFHPLSLGSLATAYAVYALAFGIASGWAA